MATRLGGGLLKQGGKNISGRGRSYSGSPFQLHDPKRVALQLQLQKYGGLYDQGTRFTPPIVSEHDQAKYLSAYDLAKQITLPLITVGPSEMLWIPTVIRNFGAFAPQIALGALNDKGYSNVDEWKADPRELRAYQELRKEIRNGTEQAGSVIMAMNWTIPLNDAFILGAVDAGKEVHVALPGRDLLETMKQHPDAFFDTKNNRCTVLGREILMSVMKGLDPVNSGRDDYGIVLLPERTGSFDLKRMTEYARELKSVGDLTKALDDELRVGSTVSMASDPGKRAGGGTPPSTPRPTTTPSTPPASSGTPSKTPGGQGGSSTSE